MPAPPTDISRQIYREAARIGFAAIGFSFPVSQPVAMRHFTDMIREKRHGEMNYMEKRMDERADPSLLFAGLRTIISAAISYNYPVNYEYGLPKISKYALIDDYHMVVRTKLEELLAAIEVMVGEPLKALITVDGSPLLEKAWAEEASIGKIGKNTLLKVPSAGSYVFLGEILIDREISTATIPLPNYCGSCSNCLERCPTGALLEPGKIDASKCISYLTGELKREFTAEEAAMIDDWLFGCDLCQEVCPYNKQASIKANESFVLKEGLMNMTTDTILNLTKSSFRELFYGTPVFRIGLRRLKRNARAVADNLKKSGKKEQ
ncbi:MAG: tRNA epoxyqueuosine(34) reductase QueG [Chlorobiaceae bacterium]|jgi:epoxyqueuosine reductase|nr:tRNA epoxyqueuosine(34) reductase QueG [Chlorobiaceae bacterium]